MHFEEINRAKNGIVDTITSLLDGLRDEKQKDADKICGAFAINENGNYKIDCFKLALKEVCDSNPDIQGRVDVFDKIYGESVKGVTFLLFLKKDKDKFDYPDIDRFYAHYPEFYTGLFNQNSRNDNALNWFIKRLFSTIITMEERSAHFGYIKLEESIVNYYGRSFVLDKLVDKIEWGRFKYRVMSLTMRKTEYLHFLIYDHEPEDKEIEKQKEYLFGCSSRLERW